MEEKGNRSRILKAAAVATVVLLAGGGLLYFLLREVKVEEPVYNPTVELPAEFVMIADYPETVEDMFATSCLSSLMFHGGRFHSLLVLAPDNTLSRQELFTLAGWNEDQDKILFSNNEVIGGINSQLEGAGLSTVRDEMSFPLTTDICGSFTGFDGALTVGSYEESLWAASYAKSANLALVEGRSTFRSQEEAWVKLEGAGIGADYIIAANPHDHDLSTIRNGTVDYDEYDDSWFCPDLSVAASMLSVYHDGYVVTRWPVPDKVDWRLNMELSQNRRAAGLLGELRDVSARYGPAEYVAIVGSATAIPQFLMQATTNGAVINSDIVYGFLDDDLLTMDAAVGRIIQFDLSLASNQLMKSFRFEDFKETVPVNYRDVAGGPQEKNWRKHGASFSGFAITYQRMQATPGRWICSDFEDAGFTYDYVGPYNTGMKLGDGVINSMENDLSEICRGSGYVAYRGHGSDYGALYGIRVYGPNGDEHQLSSEDAAEMDVPPQIAFFVSCLNGKIYGHGPGTDKTADIDFHRLFTMNYLAAGPAILIGATEVSYSNIGQDIPALRAEYGPLKDDHEWDHNDAWYAFVWDGILNHPKEHGTAGKAVQWCENRYMAYPPNNDPTPFDPKDDVDWYEVTFFSVYGDPAFRPAIDEDTQPGYDPWHNGPDDG